MNTKTTTQLTKVQNGEGAQVRSEYASSEWRKNFKAVLDQFGWIAKFVYPDSSIDTLFIYAETEGYAEASANVEGKYRDALYWTVMRYRDRDADCE